jgi:hypothetical protein
LYKNKVLLIVFSTLVGLFFFLSALDSISTKHDKLFVIHKERPYDTDVYSIESFLTLIPTFKEEFGLLVVNLQESVILTGSTFVPVFVLLL